MDNHKDQFPISKMSSVLGVSRSGYYKWAGRGPSRRAQENEQFSRHILRIWQQSGKTYGSPRIHKQMEAEGHSLSRPRVARLMARVGIASQIRRRWRRPAVSAPDRPIAANLLDRRFNFQRLGRAWVSDITYLLGAEGWLYLTMVMDLADRQIIGWVLSKGMTASATTIPALRAALQRRTPSKDGLVFHSDKGIQYSCQPFRDLLNDQRITQSMSRRGNCWDNAPAESFFKTLKAELSIDVRSASYGQIRRALFWYIEIWYNRKRLHSTLDYQTPAQVEQQLTQQQQNPAA